MSYQLLAESHHEDLLEAMHQLRRKGHLCDVTVQVDFRGELEEFEVHQVVLAASSGYFKCILLARDAPKKLFLTDTHAADFGTFLEYVYTGKAQVAKERICDVLEMSKVLDCKILTEACNLVLNPAPSSEPRTETSQETKGGLDAVKLTPNRVVKVPRRSWMKRSVDPKVAADKQVRPKKVNPQVTVEVKGDLESDLPGRRLSNRLAGRKVYVGLPKKRRLKVISGPAEAPEQDAPSSSQEEEAPTDTVMEGEEEEVEVEVEGEEEESEKTADGEIQEEDPADDPIFVEEEEEEGEEEEEEGTRRRAAKRGDTQYKCDKCQRTFLYEKSYMKHISVSHGVQAEVVYRCDTCQQTFANRGNLKIHERHVHNDERLFSCDVCAKTFKRKKDVIRHQRQVHEGGAGAIRHVCPVCSKSLSSRTALTLHERTHTGDKPFECPECQAKFSQSSALKTHRRIHTGEKPFACDQCEARFNQKHMLCYHKRSHTGEKPFMCESCGKSFASKEYLRHHANIHTGSKPYKCERCGRGFAQRNSLHQHMKTHTGERPYSCNFCDKSFTQLNALQRHQRIHTGEKPYMCGLCNRTFTDKSTVRRHTMTHDMDAPWKNYLVVLKGNMEDKKPKGLTKVKVQKSGEGKKLGGATSGAASKVQDGAVMHPAGPVTLPSDWTGPGTIALVSHPSQGGIMVIQAEGTQIVTDGSGNSILSLDTSTIGIPYSIPVSISHSIPGSSSDAMLAHVSENPSSISTGSVLETVVSQTLLAPVTVVESASEMGITGLEDKGGAESASVSGGDCVTVQTASLETEEQYPLASVPSDRDQGATEDSSPVGAMDVSMN